MTPEDLIQEYTQVTATPDAIELWVMRVEWHGQEPQSTWHLIKRLPVETLPEEIQRQQYTLLKRKRYFATCQTCRHLLSTGHMNRQTCHSCMAKQGIIF